MDKEGDIRVERYCVKPGSTVNLKDFKTACDVPADKEKVKTLFFPQILEDLSVLQAKLYAQSTYGLVIVLQAMDAAGKDGTIRHVFSHLDPNGAMWCHSSSLPARKKRMTTCGASIKRSPGGGTLAYSTGPIMKTW